MSGFRKGALYRVVKGGPFEWTSIPLWHPKFMDLADYTTTPINRIDGSSMSKVFMYLGTEDYGTAAYHLVLVGDEIGFISTKNKLVPLTPNPK